MQNEIKAVIEKHKLDKRKTYFEWYGLLCTEQKITQHCTGCTETPEFTMPEHFGGGCHECGYTGKRVNVYPVPVYLNGVFIGVY